MPHMLGASPRLKRRARAPPREPSANCGTRTRASPAPQPMTMIPAAVAMFLPEAATRRCRRRCRDRAAGRRTAGRRPSAQAVRAAIRRSAPRIRVSAGRRSPSGRGARAAAAAGTCCWPFLSFSDGRHRRREFEQLVIEQRLARLERHRHAHPVDLGHDVVDKIGLHVDVERAIERIGRGARLVRRAGSRRTDRRRAPRDAKSRRVERAARAGSKCP